MRLASDYGPRSDLFRHFGTAPAPQRYSGASYQPLAPDQRCTRRRAFSHVSFKQSCRRALPASVKTWRSAEVVGKSATFILDFDTLAQQRGVQKSGSNAWTT